MEVETEKRIRPTEEEKRYIEHVERCLQIAEGICTPLGFGDNESIIAVFKKLCLHRYYYNKKER